MRILIFTSLLFLTACAGTTTEFDKVLKNTGKNKTQRKLNEFRRGGIEKPLDIQNVSAHKFVKAAKKYVGMPHCDGGNGSHGCTDCSGLLFRVFSDVGLPLKFHGSQEMARFGKIISNKHALQKGDLVFFVRTYRTKRVITHSGIMVDSENWIHASTKKGVQIITLKDNDYWNERFVFATRLF